MAEKLSPGYSFMLRLQYPDKPGFLGRITSTIGKEGATIDSVDNVELSDGLRTREICVNCASEEHARQLIKTIKRIGRLKVLDASDRTFLMHRGGKISIDSKLPINSRDSLSMVYTPGVARVSEAIHADPKRVYDLTVKGHTVAIVTDGSAVLGLGNVGPEAALPVMEGKAMLFKRFGHLDAFPICLATQDVDEIIATVKAIAPAFGGINLEDISAPRCFEIEERLQRELDIPVFHDDQHGTAVVILAALMNALRVVKKQMRRIRVIMSGVGAAGVATIRLLQECGCRDIVACDTAGAIYNGRTEHMNPIKEWVAKHTNSEGAKGSLKQVIRDADVFIGVSAPGILTRKDVRKMAKDAIVFALANPIAEISPEEAGRSVRIMASGRSDYPNQINNVLCFPGLFHGALSVRAKKITLGMKIAAARAIAGIIAPRELNEDHIIPSVFNAEVSTRVSEAVSKAARKDRVARLK